MKERDLVSVSDRVSDRKEPDSTSTLRGKVGFLLSSVTNSGRTGICKSVMTVAISLVLQSVVGVSGERPRSASEVNQYLNRNFFSYQRSHE
jgi:hypothetical protein